MIDKKAWYRELVGCCYPVEVTRDAARFVVFGNKPAYTAGGAADLAEAHVMAWKTVLWSDECKRLEDNWVFRGVLHDVVMKVMAELQCATTDNNNEGRITMTTDCKKLEGVYYVFGHKFKYDNQHSTAGTLFEFGCSDTGVHVVREVRGRMNLGDFIPDTPEADHQVFFAGNCEAYLEQLDLLEHADQRPPCECGNTFKGGRSMFPIIFGECSECWEYVTALDWSSCGKGGEYFEVERLVSGPAVDRQAPSPVPSYP